MTEVNYKVIWVLAWGVSLLSISNGVQGNDNLRDGFKHALNNGPGGNQGNSRPSEVEEATRYSNNPVNSQGIQWKSPGHSQNSGGGAGGGLTGPSGSHGISGSTGQSSVAIFPTDPSVTKFTSSTQGISGDHETVGLEGISSLSDAVASSGIPAGSGIIPMQGESGISGSFATDADEDVLHPLGSPFGSSSTHLPQVTQLQRANLFEEDPPKLGFACEGSTLTINCGPDKRISIERANYGRFKRDICLQGEDSTQDWNTQCMSRRSINVVMDMCDWKPETCNITADIETFGDPCQSTPKYLQVEYRCLPGTGITGVPSNPGNRPRPVRPSLPTLLPETTRSTAIPTSTTSTTTSKPNTTTTTTTTTTTKPSTSASTTTTRPPTQRAPSICPAVERRKLQWPTTTEGETVTLTCPNNPSAFASWKCGRNGWENNPVLSKCVSKDVTDLQAKVKDAISAVGSVLSLGSSHHDGAELEKAKEGIAVDIVESVANELVVASSKPMAETYGGDVDGITSVMKEIVSQVDTHVLNISKPAAKKFVNTVNQAVVTSSSNMLDKEKTESWLDLPQAEQAMAATRVISSVEDSAFQVARLAEAPTVQITVDINIVVEVNVIDTTGKITQDVCFPRHDELQKNKGWEDNGNSIRISSKTIHEMGEKGLARLIFTTYKNLEQYLGAIQSDGRSPVQYADEYAELSGRKGETKYANDYNSARENEVNKGHMDQKEMENEREKIARDMMVNTQIISASINGKKSHMAVLPEPVFYTLEHKTENNVYDSTCAFWEYSEKTMDGHWSEFGCSVHDTNLTHTVCKCSHLTNFAVLMDVTGVAMTREHEFALTFITYLGCLISIVCLIMAWITFQFIKNLQCDRNTIHKNLVACLLIAELIFLAGIAQYDKEILCRVVALVLHYFFLASFAWMCLEGIQLYVMLIEVFEAERSRKLWYYLAGYGTPAIIVGITAAVNYRGYGTPTYCWLSIEGGFIWAFVGPVIAVITVNIVMLSIAIYMMCKHARATAAWKMKQKTKLQNVSEDNATCTTVTSEDDYSTQPSGFKMKLMWIKGAVVLVVLLGLTWTFGLMYANKHSMVFAYVFTILNTLQGLFIYIFHCATNDKVQKEYKKWVRHATCLPECIRVKYGGAPASYSSTPNQSMSSGNAIQRLLSNRFRKRSSTTSLQKSTSVTSPGGKWIYHNGRSRSDTPSNSRDSAIPIMSDSGLSPRESAFYSEVTEDQGGYLEPVSLCAPDIGIDYNGELSYMEGSVCDSNYFDNICSPTSKKSTVSMPPINVEKYKIQRNPNDSFESNNHLAPIAQESDGEYESEMGNFSDETLRRMAEKERMLDDYEDRGLLPKSDSEQSVSCLKEDQSLSSNNSLKRISSDSGNIDTSSLNDLNKDACNKGSQNDLCLSEPNIGVSTGSSPVVNKDMPVKSGIHSMDGATTLDKNTYVPEEYAIDKLKKALSNSNDGLVTLYHGKAEDNRLSHDTQQALNQHNMRLHSSDC